MYDKIKSDIVVAMKEKNTMKLQTLRGVKGAVDLEHINKKVEINDDLVLTILTREIKSRKESIVEFEKGSRQDLIDKTQEEIELLTTYLPKQLSEEEVLNIINEAFKKINPTSPKDMGLIMKEVTPQLKGKADMGKVSSIIKDLIAKL